MNLEVLCPEKRLVECPVSLAEFPGKSGRFVVLEGHDAIVSSLSDGEIRYVQEGAGEERIHIRSGFVSVKDNSIKACVEI